MSEQAILTNYSVYVVAEILALLNIKLKHVIDTGVALTDDMIAEKADQLVLMCKKAAQLEGRRKVRSSKDTVGIAVAYMRSEFGNVGIRIEKMRKRKIYCQRMYVIKADQMEDVKRLTIENVGLLHSRNIEMVSTIGHEVTRA